MDGSPGAGAGSSSAEEYRSRRADWLASGGRAARRRAWIAAAVLFGLAVIGIVVLRGTAGASDWLVWTLLAIGAAVAIGVALVFGAPPSGVADLDAQARAERTVARAMTALQRSGYTLLVDRTLPGLHGHLDLLVIGPSGIFALQVVPAWVGFRTEHTTVLTGRIPLNAVAESAARTAQVVAESLAGVLTEWAEITVQPIVVAATHKPLPVGLEAVIAIPVIEYRRLPDWLLHAYPRSLTDLHVASLVATAETLFPPARALTDTTAQFLDDPARPDSPGGTG